MTKQKIIKAIIMALIAALTALATGLGLTSCNVTRVITNESQYLQRGDTSVVIQTKTVETYDAKKTLLRDLTVLRDLKDPIKVNQEPLGRTASASDSPS